MATEPDPAVKHLKMAGLCTALFRQSWVELAVVGGAAIEFFTEGAHVSGGIDLCAVNPASR
jgi:hypothetical protein